MDLYESLRLKAKPGEALNPRSIDKVIEEFLTTQQAKSANRYRDINNIIVIHFRSYTEGQKVDWLDGASITGHFDWRRQQSRWGKNTSENTINSEAGEVLRFLRWCKDRKYCERCRHLKNQVARMFAALPSIEMIGIGWYDTQALGLRSIRTRQ